MVNTNMLRARRGESTDEWYTTWPVVDRELSRHMDGLRGARVYCNCDGPESMFAQWFAMHYTQLGLAGLRLSRFNPASHTLFAPDASGDTWEWDGAGWVHARLHGDGSFDSVECLRFAAQADVVCTNPPLSRLGQYLPLMVEHARHVLVLGNMNAVKYHGVFPLMMGGRLRLGYDTSRMGFMVDGERPAVLSTARWFTTLPVERAPFHPQGTGEGLPVFDAHPDVVCVDRLVLLPDRPGLYGVPVTVFDRLPDPCWRVRGLFTSGTHSYGMGAPMVGGRERFARVLIERLPN